MIKANMSTVRQKSGPGRLNADGQPKLDKSGFGICSFHTLLKTDWICVGVCQDKSRLLYHTGVMHA